MVRHEDPTAEQGAPKLRTPDLGHDLRGSTVGPYNVISLLGEGGFGSVYLAEQISPVQRRVALKVIKPGMDSRSVVARFEAERQALAMMDHPSVAKVFDAGLTAHGLPYFVMELVRGEPITRFCEMQRVGVEDRVRLMIQVCRAVQHAHMKGVIHRDLKPSNVLVESVDGNPLVRVIDFGVAKALHQRLSDNTIYTEQGQMIGTPEYMSPEQARGLADVDTRADVYALGAVLYELLTGVTPMDLRKERSAGFLGVQRTLEDVFPLAPSKRLSQLVKASPPQSMRSLDTPLLIKHVRGELDWIVMKCLEKERSRRYDSAAALADDLERFLKDEPVLSGPPSAAYRAAKFVRRHRVAVSAGSAILIVLVAGIIVSSYGFAEALRERKLASDQKTAAERARDESDAVTRFLTEMIASVHPDEAGRDVTVREVLDRAALRLGTDFGDRPNVEARLRHAIGVSYWQLGRLDDADKHLPVAWAIRRGTLGPDHVDTLMAMSNLAALRLAQGRDSEAEELLRQAVDGFTRTVGADNALTLGALSNLAVARSRRVLDDEALVLHQRVLEGQRRSLGPDHPHTLGAMGNLADLLSEMNRLDEAEPLMREAVAGWERTQGPDRPGTLTALHNLAMLQLNQGRLEEAAATMRRVVDSRSRVFGEQHVETLSAMTNLGLILSKQDKPEEAEAVYSTAWHGLCASLGAHHPTAIHAAMQLIDVLKAQGWPTRGHQITSEIIESARTVLQQPDAQPSNLNDLAWWLLNVEPEELRDIGLAVAMASRACEDERARRGSSLWMYLDTLASAQHQSGSSASALASQRECLRVLPATAEDYRKELESRLHEYEKASGSQ